MTASRAHRGTWRYGLVLALTVPAAGTLPACTQNRALLQPALGLHVWPAPPEPPRVRYIGEISGAMAGSNDRSRAAEILFGPTPQRQLVTPSAVAVDGAGERVAIADPNGLCVHVLQLATNKSVAIDSAGRAPLEGPMGTAWGENQLFVSDPQRKVVDVFDIRDMDVQHVRSISGIFERPVGLAFDAKKGLLHVCDSARHTVFVVDPAGTLVRSIGGPGSGPGQLRFPTNVTCADDGSSAVADSMNFRVQRFSSEGQFVGGFGRKGDAAGDLALPKGVAFDSQGNVWVVDAQFENVQAFNPNGELLLALGGEGHGPGEFWLPAGAAIDRQQRLWVADTYNRRVQIFQLMP